jgi:hypothetical protein
MQATFQTRAEVHALDVAESFLCHFSTNPLVQKLLWYSGTFNSLRAIDGTPRVRPRKCSNVWHPNWHWTESHDKGASRQGALNDVTGVAAMECSRKRRESRRSREHLLTEPRNALPREAFPDEFVELLQKGMLRRCTGILLLGSFPESAERDLMLSEALTVTVANGPAGIVLPSYRLHGTDFHTHTQSAGGSPFTCSKRLAHLPLFSSVESAYSNGCRRIVVLDDCEPHYAVPHELLEEYADDVCFILCVDDVNCGDAFEWATAATWQDLERLIGALCWTNFRGTRHAVSLYDAFVPDVRSMSVTRYERPADAVRTGRQLRWERQALRLLVSNQVTWLQLRHHLYASALIDPDVDWSRTKEGLRDWLLDQVISLRRSTTPAPSAGERLH